MLCEALLPRLRLLAPCQSRLSSSSQLLTYRLVVVVDSAMICVSEHITVMTGVLGIAHALTSSHLAEEKTEGQRGSPASEYEMVMSP